ncbi:hypothetical protein [Deinococcus depolymerans]|uniref:Uncharacterized protein n=1 Tax=Deinococcus depolymerans TaxID=392408 RepID=A0ABN1BIV8_9DEIO
MKYVSMGLISLAALLSSCGQPDTPQATAPAHTGRTIILGAPGAGAQRLANGARIEPMMLRSQLLPIDSEIGDGEIIVPITTTDPAATQLLSAVPGDNIVSAPTTQAPYGFVREVTATSMQGGNMVIETVESSLEESVQDMDLVEDYNVPLTSLQSVVYADGTRYDLKPEDFGPVNPSVQTLDPQKTFNIAGINKNFDHKIADCGTGAIKLTGTLSANLQGFINVKISWFSLKKVEAGVNLAEKANLTLDATCTFGFTQEAHLLTLNYGTYVIWAGPVPIVVTPSVELYVGANGQVTAQVKYTVEQTFNGRYGVGWYKGEGFRSISETSKSFNQSLTINGSGKLRGWVGAKAGLKFYGVAFAYGYPKAFLEGNVSYANSQFNYCLDAGLSIAVGARLKVLGRNLGEWSKDLGETRTQLLCGATGGGVVTPPPPVTPPLPPREPINPCGLEVGINPLRCQIP